MSVFFTRRGKAPSKSALVTITGTGKSSRCYVVIDGTTYTEAASDIAVMSGDIITFGVRGTSYYKGKVTIDGVQVLATNSTQTYDWTVPEGISAITITLSYTTTGSYGTITVTTS